jgi:hypothetical protein
MQNRAGPTCEIRSWSTSPFGNSFLEFFRGNFFFSEPPNIFQAALSGPVRMVWSAPVTVGWGAEHSQPLLAGPTCEISSKHRKTLDSESALFNGFFRLEKLSIFETLGKKLTCLTLGIYCTISGFLPFNYTIIIQFTVFKCTT